MNALGLAVVLACLCVSVGARADVACFTPVLEALAPGASPSDELAQGERDIAAGRLEAAAARLRAVAFSRPVGPASTTAAELYTQVVMRLSERADRTESCTARLDEDVARLRDASCALPVPSERAQACNLLAAVQGHAARRRGDSTLAEASRAGPERSRALHGEAGRHYARAVDAFLPGCRAGDRLLCEPVPELLFNAAHALRRAGKLREALDVLATLVDPKSGLPPSDLVRKGLVLRGQALLSIADFSGALDAFERAGAIGSKELETRHALSDAVLLALALGDTPRARAAEEQLLRLRVGPEAARLALAIAEELERDGQPREVIDLLGKRMKLIEKLDLDDRARAHLLLARAHAALGNAAKAMAGWKTVIGVVSRDLPASGTEPSRALGRTLVALGEAQLEIAMPLVRAALEARVRKGDATSVKDKRALIDRAEKALLEILDQRPVPPPQPTVDAAALAARMQGQLWAQIYVAEGADAAEPQLARAKSAYRKCVDLSVKLQVTTGRSRRCAAWLERHFPDEHRALTELQPVFVVAPSRLPAPAPDSTPTPSAGAQLLGGGADRAGLAR